MADRKISDLTALTTPAAGDYLPIVDISESAAASKNKRITIEELMRGAPDGTAAAPGIAFESDPNTGIYSPGADQVAISTNGTGRLFIDASGNVGIGTGSPATTLDVNGDVTITDKIIHGGDTNTAIRFPAADTVSVETAGSERARIDSSGRLLVGTSSASGTNTLFESSSTAANSANVALVKRNSGTANQAGQQLHFYNFGPSATARDADTEVGNIRFYGSQPTSGAAQEMASIQCAADALQAGLNTNGRLVFSTTASSASPTERLRITSAGQVQAGGLGTAAAPVLSFLSDPNTGIYSPGADQVAISTNGTGRLFVDASGNVGVGTSTPGNLLEISANLTSNPALLALSNTATSGTLLAVRQHFNVYTGSAVENCGEILATGSSWTYSNYGANTFSLIGTKSGGVGIRAANAPIIFYNGNANVDSATERARIDSSGRLLVGTSSARSVGAFRSTQIEGISTDNTGLTITHNASSTGAPVFSLAKTRSATVGGNTIVQVGDELGYITFNGSDGTDANQYAAWIRAIVEGTPANNSVASRLEFSTTADGAASPTERLRITSAGVLQVADAGDITVGTTTGTKIGTATTQKLGFYNATPVVQPAAVADATTAIDVITQLNDLLAKLRTLGIIAT
jgi:hypothetical protein